MSKYLLALTNGAGLSNLAAINRTIDALDELGRLEQVDDALIALARGLAKAVDDEPNNASLWREYRATEQALREVGKSGSDQVDTFWDRVQSEIRNAAQPVQGDKGA